MAVGIYFVRYRRKKLGVPRLRGSEGGFRAWNVAVVFSILVNLYLLVMPWYPPASGANGGDVSFWYGTYVVTGIAILVACALYYAFWIKILPHFGNYRIRHEKLVLEGGEVTHRLVKVPLDKLQAWDLEHDAQGRQIVDASSDDDSRVAQVPVEELKG
ncbi:MAG: hypothetical protein Q9160_003205 [Pyrenula sp. 1 TL-2023]